MLRLSGRRQAKQSRRGKEVRKQGLSAARGRLAVREQRLVPKGSTSLRRGVAGGRL